MSEKLIGEDYGKIADILLTTNKGGQCNERFKRSFE